ncbi:MAG: hypothetical protein WD469_04000 [Paenibacillaceae bacterium]
MKGWINVGVKFAREYETIIVDLVQAIGEMKGCAEFIGIDSEQWVELDEADRTECLRTLADDIFYGLGTEPILRLGDGIISYDIRNHTIQVKYDHNKIIRVIYLI